MVGLFFNPLANLMYSDIICIFKIRKLGVMMKFITETFRFCIIWACILIFVPILFTVGGFFSLVNHVFYKKDLEA